MAILDVVTLPEAKNALDIALTDLSQDGELAAHVTSVSRRLDDAIGPVVQRSVTVRRDGGRPTIWLTPRPVAAFTTVTEYNQAGVATVLVAEDEDTKPIDAYLASPYKSDATLFSGRLYRRRSGSDGWFASGRSNVVVAYTAGRAADTAEVAPIYKQAAQIMLANLWRSQEQSTASLGEFDVPAQNFPRFAVPNAVKELLADEWQDNRHVLLVR